MGQPRFFWVAEELPLLPTKNTCPPTVFAMTSYLMLLNAGDLTLHLLYKLSCCFKFPSSANNLLAVLAQVDTIYSCEIDIQILHGVLNFV